MHTDTYAVAQREKPIWRDETSYLIQCLLKDRLFGMYQLPMNWNGRSQEISVCETGNPKFL